MLTLKKFLITAVTILGIAFSVPAFANTSVPILLCPWGCGPTESDQMLMNLQIRGNKPVNVLPQETPGYMYNIREMVNPRHHKQTIFGTEDAIIQLAMQGGRPELKDSLPDPIDIRFKLLYGDAWWGQGKFFVTFNPNIKTPADFKGKRVAIGMPTQSAWGLYPKLFLEHAYGINEKNTDIRRMPPAAQTQALIDGSIDVAITGFGSEPQVREIMVSAPLRLLEATGRPLYYIPVSKQAVDQINKKFQTTFIHANIRAGSLPRQTQDLSMAFVRSYKAAHPDFPEQTAYELVKSVAEYAPRLQGNHPLWKLMTRELMLHGLSEENVHPGARRAFVELGWWPDHKKYPPVTYPKK
jgi:hypothetical protein